MRDPKYWNGETERERMIREVHSRNFAAFGRTAIGRGWRVARPMMTGTHQ